MHILAIVGYLEGIVDVGAIIYNEGRIKNTLARFEYSKTQVYIPRIENTIRKVGIFVVSLLYSGTERYLLQKTPEVRTKGLRKIILHSGTCQTIPIFREFFV